MASVLHAKCMIVTSAPVRHNKSVKSPLIYKNFLQHMAVFICINSIYFIIRRHDGLRLAFFDRNLESGCINLTERSFVYDRIICHTAQLLAVCCEMLWTSCNSFALDSTDICRRHLSCMIRIFRKVLKISSTQRASLDIQSRSEDHIDSHCHCLFCKCFSNLFSKCFIPAVCHSCCCRKTSCRKTCIQSQMISCTRLSSQSVRSVRHYHRRNSIFFKINGLPCVLS